MKQLTRKRLTVLNQTIKYYGQDPSRRGMDEHENCTYISKDKKCCAIGRLVTQHQAKLLNDIPGGDVSSVFTTLPLKVQGYGQQFLADLQSFHDYEPSWSLNDDKYLSTIGIRDVERMCENYEIPLDQVKLTPEKG